MVCNTSKRFFPAMAVGFSDPRVQLHICDGIKYVQDAEEGSFDFIVVDSSDPVGPAELLFERPFFEALHRALKPGGMICTQAECQWLHMPIIKALAAMCADIFKGGSVSYGVTQTPTYPCGQIGMMVCAKAGPNGEVADPRKAVRPPPGAVPSLGIPDLKYYTPDVHAAAFALPKFTADALNGSLTFQ